MKNANIVNVIGAIVFAGLLVANLLDLTGENLESKIALQVLAGLVFVLLSKLKVKKLQDRFKNIFCLYGLFFWLYSIIGSIVFVLDDKVPRFYFFKINDASMTETLSLYINAFCIYGIICFATNSIKVIKIDEKVKTALGKNNLSSKSFTIITAIAMIITMRNVLKIVITPNFLDLSVAGKRAIINDDLSHYANLFMVVLSLFAAHSVFITKKHVPKILIMIAALYWLTVLTCERRMFVMFFIGLAIMLASKIQKLKPRYTIAALLIVLGLLGVGALRDNITTRNHDIRDVIYSSTTEFYCTFMISNSYVVNNPELRYGETYTYDSITKMIPKAMYPSKPDDLSIQYKRQYKTNVGFAYNPIAEAILNFGTGLAPLVTAMIMFAICGIAVRLGRSNALYYILFVVLSIDFCRGAFSNLFFDTVFGCLLIMFMIKISKKEKVKDDA